MQFSILPIFSFIPLTLAQYGGGSGSTTTSTSSSAAPATTTSSSSTSIQTVTVGNGALAFSPNSFTAAVGSQVEFVFFPPTHSVAQSSFASPCTPLNNGTGFFSGEMTTATGENANVFTVTINDTNPIWFYCTFPGHCESGMGGVINPP